MKWTDKQPTRPGKYKMRDSIREYTIYVVKHGTGLAFKEKGQNQLYTFGGTDGCKWKKCN